MADPQTPNPTPTGATPNPEPVPTPDPKPVDDDQLGEGGKKALAAERKRADDAEKLAKKLQADADKAAADKAAADAKDAEAKGEWERLATERAEAIKAKETDLSSAIAERDALKARVEARDAEDIATIAKWIADHKGAVDDFLDFYPGKEAPADAQMTWFNATRPKVEKRITNPVNGNGRSPQAANGQDPKADEEARLAQARTTKRTF